MSIEEIKSRALLLSAESRAHLARELLESLDTLNEAETEKLWIDEALRRDRELDEGTAKSSPADEVFRRVKANRK